MAVGQGAQHTPRIAGETLDFRQLGRIHVAVGQAVQRCRSGHAGAR